jgi:micrococcal nuclease
MKQTKGMKRLLATLTIPLLYFFSHFAFSTSDIPVFYSVQRVVDGDTVKLEKIGKVRLIGVDTPETKDPRRPVQYFGKEASEFLSKTLSGKKVRLEYDQNPKDKYQRTLAYLFLEDGTFVNALIIKEGYGFAYTRFPFKHLEEFRNLERQAREQKKGLWANQAEVAKRTTSQKPNAPSAKTLAQGPCASKKACWQIQTCEEAKQQLKDCGPTGIDGDRDGIPCERLCF